MGKRARAAAAAAATASASALSSLFSSDNPFRRRPSPPPDQQPPPQSPSRPSAKRDRPRPEERSPNSVENAECAPKKSKAEEIRGVRNPNSDGVGVVVGDGASRRKRNRDELELDYEKKRFGVEVEPGKERSVAAHVGVKRKAAEPTSGNGESPFDDAEKLRRTVFVGNLPLKTRPKALIKEFSAFGEVESCRIRSVPLIDTKIPRKGAIFKGKINDAVDSVHAYIVFKDEKSASTALSHNMTVFGGNHLRVDMACPPRKKSKGEGRVYDKRRTLFVGNLPFDIKDEELYGLFCGVDESESKVEAIRVIRDPNTSMGKGVAYILFKTVEAATVALRNRDVKVRDRVLRICRVKSSQSPQSESVLTKRKDPQSDGETHQNKTQVSERWSPPESGGKFKSKYAAYQGVRVSKSGTVKKSTFRPRTSTYEASKGGQPEPGLRKAKRPAVAARKAKQLREKRKRDPAAPENADKSKSAKHQQQLASKRKQEAATPEGAPNRKKARVP